ncbi:MAG: type I-C CRISPR-associated protein Cas8c/Csd1 [Rhodomicrobium sp.]
MTILQSLAAFYDRLDRRGDAPRTGYAPVGVSFAIPIARDGSVDKVIDLRDHGGGRPFAVDRMLPKVRDHNNSGQDPFLFWDNTGYALGLVKKEMKRGSPDGLFKSFKAANLAATEGATSPELMAFRAFLVRWRPEQQALLGILDNDLDTNIVFRCIETGRLIHDVEEASSIWRGILNPNDAPNQLCLVSGELRPQARLHPKFPSLVAGGNRAPIVSFNEKSFESYGKDQGANAPVSEEAAFKYGAALNWLLDPVNSRRFRLGETTVVFWADEKEYGEEAAEAAEDRFWTDFGTDDRGETEDEGGGGEKRDGADANESDIDAEEAAKIGAQAQNIRHLRKPPDLSKLKPETRLHVLGLSPNSGRIAVRFWLVDTWGHLEENLKRHKRDTAIEPPGPNPDQKAYALLYETAVQRKRENIPPRLGGELARAILTGGHYPRTLYAAVIARIRADKTINAARAGLCKAVINRDHDEEEIPVALNPESDDGAYNLGRLFAVYEYAERSVADRNATIRDKFIGAASATPRRVFPLLMRGYEHNASALAKGEGNQRGAGTKAAKAVSQILDRFGGEMPFPAALPIEDQGRFFVGYYHQRAALYTKSDRCAPSENGAGAEGEEQ